LETPPLSNHESLKMFTSTSNSTATINVFDFDAIRLPPDFEREGGVRRQLTRLSVRKPRPQEWIRVNPDPAYSARVATIVYKEGDDSKEEIYLVAPHLIRDLEPELTYTTLYLAISRQGSLFIWPCRDPNPESKRGDIAATSRIEAAQAAMQRYVRVQWRSPAYEYSFRDETIVEVEPTWPDKPFKELGDLAVTKMGMLISDLNHQVVKIIQGRN
jgi:hypothetical protein